ncbi:hypothetical protein C347_05013 [Cryptococcus neoformans AD2-60a]|nr:hypothetical protein C347_05013 [Cryptococcus neoformans var. grubii AD2-60a]
MRHPAGGHGVRQGKERLTQECGGGSWKTEREKAK